MIHAPAQTHPWVACVSVTHNAGQSAAPSDFRIKPISKFMVLEFRHPSTPDRQHHQSVTHPLATQHVGSEASRHASQPPGHPSHRLALL